MATPNGTRQRRCRTRSPCGESVLRCIGTGSGLRYSRGSSAVRPYIYLRLTILYQVHRVCGRTHPCGRTVGPGRTLVFFLR